MSNQTILSITDARRDIFNITKEVQKPGVVYTLTDKGRPKAVIMSADEFESWAETLDVLREFPDILSTIKAAEADYTDGQAISWRDILPKDK